MNDRNIRIICCIVIFVCCFFSGISCGVIINSVSEIKTKAAELRANATDAEVLIAVSGDNGASLENTDELFKPFWEAWQLLHAYYVDQPLDDNAMMEGAINGMIEALGDPHTRYADPEEYSAEKEYISGEYQGIGAYVDVSGEYVRITEIIEGSPAEEAGLKPDDLVIGLNGEDVTGVDPNEVLQNIRGPEGSTVLLTIKRGEEVFEAEVARRRIDSPSVTYQMLDDDIAYIKMSQFGDKTTAELQEALDAVMKEDPKGLILDLRSNGGGWVDTAVAAASEFLPLNTLVLTEKDGDGTQRDYYTRRGGGRALDVPMAVLINQGSASASEILTGALRCNDRATVVGMKSYGKGSMQIQSELSNGGAVSVTIARWYLPDGTLIHGEGITPDIEVDYTKEDYDNGLDPQLDAAVNCLKESR